MKKIIFSALAALLMLSCADRFDEQQGVDSPLNKGRKFSISVSDNKSRSFLNDSLEVRWTQGDYFSVFETTQNIPYCFIDETGAEEGMIWQAAPEEEGHSVLQTCYAVFPYKENTTISVDGVISYDMPAVQTYVENSFGLEDNTMIGVSYDINDDEILFYNACGIIKLQLYGNTSVYSISLRGNNNERIAGPSTIYAVYGEEPQVTMGENATKTITIDCGEEGVELSRDAENPTTFFFVVPEVSFTKGFTITINDTYIKSVSKTIDVEQDMIQPMAAFGYFNDDINFRYTTHDGNCVNFKSTDLDVVSQEKIGDWWIVNSRMSNFLTGFKNYENIKDLVIPGVVDYVKHTNIFEGTNKLESIEIAVGTNPLKWQHVSYGVGTAAVHPFEHTRVKKVILNREIQLYDVNNPDNNEAFSFRELKYADNEIEEVIINYPLESLKSEFFHYLWALKSITLPPTLTKICSLAFANTGIESLTIPSSVTEIENDVFDKCSKLKSLNIEDGPEPLKIGYNEGFMSEYGPFYDSPLETVHIGRELIYDCGGYLDEWDEGILGISKESSLKQVTIGKYVKTLTPYFFANNKALASVTIPGNVISIGNDAFYNCIGLKELIFEKNTENKTLELDIDTESTPDEGLFAWCKSLSSLTLARNLKYPASYPPFKSDWKITIDNILLKDGCTSLGKKLFYDNLETNCTITSELSTPPAIEDNSFNWNKVKGVTLRVPKGSQSNYTKTLWSQFNNMKEY